jgi:hypothetical protein
MGQWGILKANLGSIFTQRKLETALAEGDDDTVRRLITESIVKILKVGLTPNERRNLDELKQLHRQEMRDIMESAFQRGWMRDGKPNLSNAMDEVLIEVAERIRQGREEGAVRRFE